MPYYNHHIHSKLPKIGTTIKRRIKQIHIIFKNFLKSFFGNNDMKNNTTIEINKKIICFNINKIGYSSPIKE